MFFTSISDPTYLILKVDAGDAEKLIDQLSNAAARFRGFPTDAENALMPLKLKTDLDKIGPPARLPNLRAAQIPQFGLNRYIATDSHDLA